MQKIKNWDKIQIPREMRLKHYDVYYEGHGVGCYAENYQKTNKITCLDYAIKFTPNVDLNIL